MITPFEAQQMQERLAWNRRKPLDPLDSLPCEKLAQGVGCEADLHNDILEDCKARGWIALHGSMAQATGRTLGEWDFVIVADYGRVFLIECKTKTGKLTPEQAGMKAWAEKLGHKPSVVRSMAEYLEAIK